MRHHLLIPLVLLAATGCDELDPYTPDVVFQGLEIREIDFQDASVDFVFAVENPNPIQLGLSSFSYNFGLEEVPLLTGDNEQGFQLEPQGASDLVLPVDIVWADTFRLVQATRGVDNVGFGLDGHLGFGLPQNDFDVNEIRLPYQESGDFPALRTPNFAVKKLRVQNVNLLSQTATLALDIEADNDHGSNIAFDAFDYSIDLGGSNVANGLVGSLGAVGGASTEQFTLPLEINLLAVGDTVVRSIVQRKRMDVRLDAVMDVDTPFGIVPLGINERGQVQVE